MLTPKELTDIAVKTLDQKKAENIKVLETRDVTVLADYFVICTAGSTTHIKTLSDEVEAALEAQGEHALHRGLPRRRLGAGGLWVPGGPHLHRRDPQILQFRAPLGGRPPSGHQFPHHPGLRSGKHEIRFYGY